jgi:hypothetical protein
MSGEDSKSESELAILFFYYPFQRITPFYIYLGMIKGD